MVDSVVPYCCSVYFQILKKFSKRGVLEFTSIIIDLSVFSSQLYQVLLHVI